MNIFFFISLTLILFVLQTLILPSFSWFSNAFDLMIIEVLYLSLFSKRSSVILIIILIGALMDSASGVPFFFYIFSYSWIFIVVQLVSQFLFQRSVLFVMVISMVSVMVQQCLLLLTIFIQQGGAAVTGFDYGILIRQIFWGLILIPSGIWLIHLIRAKGLKRADTIKEQLDKKYGSRI